MAKRNFQLNVRTGWVSGARDAFQTYKDSNQNNAARTALFDTLDTLSDVGWESVLELFDALDYEIRGPGVIGKLTTP